MLHKKSPCGIEPVEFLRAPASNPAPAYTTNMFGTALWTATWKPSKKNFDVNEVFDLSKVKGGEPLKMHFVDGGKTMYITTANPILIRTFDLSRYESKQGKSLVTGQGARHVGLTHDERYDFVQNSFINFPGMQTVRFPSWI